MLLLTIIPLLCNCSVTSAKKVGPNGVVSSFYNGAVGGKGGAVQGSPNSADFVASYYDNEKSFRDGVVGLATYGVSRVIGSAFEAAQAAKTAQHAATSSAGIANARTAANVANTGTTANLIQNVNPELVPIAPIALPASP